MKIEKISAYTPRIKTQNPVFGAMKASQFEGLDYACMRQFKAPIEKFNEMKDFYNWAADKLNKKSGKNLTGKSKETEERRKVLISGWQEGLKNYSPAVGLVAIMSVLKNLKPSNDALPPLFNNTVFEETLADVEGALALERDFKFDISKVYKSHLKSMFFSIDKETEIKDGWITIPSASEDNNTSKNAELLNTLSYKTWCTKGVKSEIYLQDFGFRIYVKNGEPELCIRLLGREVCEIQGRLNNSQIPEEYKQLVIDYIEENGFTVDCDTDMELYGGSVD